MALYFFETSALVKRYVSEKGTAWVEGLLIPALHPTVYIAQITGVESIAAITLRTRRGDTTQQEAAAAIANFRRDYAHEYLMAQVTNALIAVAMDLAEKHALRGYDAVQLASALQVQTERQVYGLSPPIFLSADNNLNASAAAEGLAVDNPNLHP
jgi:predicted nucleic acid-binding protein